MQQEFFRHILKNTQISNLMKIRIEETDLFHAGGRVDGRTDRGKEKHDAASDRVFAILRTGLRELCLPGYQFSNE